MILATSHMFLRASTAVLAMLVLTGCAIADAPRSPFDAGRAYADLEAIVAIGPRFPGSEGSAATADYLERELAAAGLTLDRYGFTAYTPLGRRPMTNLSATCQGTRPGTIILSGHYDTKYLPYIEFVGANDAGSSTAFLLEMARTLGPTREGYSVQFVWFDGEEAIEEWSDMDSLYGSREMVRRLNEERRLNDICALINVDMIGDCHLNILRDPGAPAWLRDAIWDTAAELGKRNAFTRKERGMDDDHIPFRQAAVPAINLIDFEYGANRLEHDQNWHTERDTLDRVCAGSLQTVADVLYHALPKIEAHLMNADAGADASAEARDAG